MNSNTLRRRREKPLNDTQIGRWAKWFGRGWQDDDNIDDKNIDDVNMTCTAACWMYAHGLQKAILLFGSARGWVYMFDKLSMYERIFKGCIIRIQKALFAFSFFHSFFSSPHISLSAIVCFVSASRHSLISRSSALSAAQLNISPRLIRSSSEKEYCTRWFFKIY